MRQLTAKKIALTERRRISTYEKKAFRLYFVILTALVKNYNYGCAYPPSNETLDQLDLVFCSFMQDILRTGWTGLGLKKICKSSCSPQKTQVQTVFLRLLILPLRK